MPYYNDDGTEFNPELIPTPDLCTTCRKHESAGPEENVLCNLTRADAMEEDVFICFAYQPSSPNIDRKAVLRKLCQQAEIPCTEADLAEPAGSDADANSF